MRGFRVEDCYDGCDLTLLEDDVEVLWYSLVGMPNHEHFRLASKVGKAWMDGHDDQIDLLVFNMGERDGKEG